MPDPKKVGTMIAAVVACVLGLAACPGSDLSAQLCPAGTSVAKAAPTIAVLVGITAADDDTQLAAQRQTAFAKVLDAGFAARSHLLVDVIGGHGSDARLTIDEQLQVQGANPLECKTHQRSIQARLTKAFADTVATPIAGQPDVVAALATLSGHLGAAPDADVVIMSSLLNSADGVNHADPGTVNRDPAQQIAQLQAGGLLPDCTSWRISAVGAGRAASGGVDDATEAALHRFWDRLFTRCGGRLWRWESQLSVFPAQVPSPPPPPLVPVPTLELPSAVLFASGHFDLGPDAAAALEQILTFIDTNLKTFPSALVEIAGYTDDQGSVAGNQLLSERRSEIIARYVIDHGPPGLRVRAVGYGPTDPVCTQDTPECRQQNRRVKVSVVPV